MRFSKDLWPRKGGKITALHIMAPSQPQAIALSPSSSVNIFKHSPQQTCGVCPEGLTVITIVWLSALETHIYEDTPNLSFSSSPQTCAPFFAHKKILHTPFLTIAVNLSLTPDTITSVFDNPFTFWFCYLENRIQTCKQGVGAFDWVILVLSLVIRPTPPAPHTCSHLSIFVQTGPCTWNTLPNWVPDDSHLQDSTMSSLEFLPDYHATSIFHICTVFLA